MSALLASPSRDDVAATWMTWSEWCALAHARPLPLAVLDEIAELERDGVPEDDADA